MASLSSGFSHHAHGAEKRRIPLYAALVGFSSALGSAFPVAVGIAIGGVGLVLLTLVMPEVGLVLSLFAGRFSDFAFSDQLPKWVYAALPLLILTALGAALIIARGERKRVVGWVYPLAMALVLLQGASFSMAPEYGTIKSLEFIIYTLPLFVLTQVVLQGTGERVQSLLFFTFLASSFFALAGLAQGPGTDSRIAAFGGGPNVFARLVSLGALGVPPLWNCWKDAFRRTALIGATGVMFLAAALSGSRGSLLSLVFCAFCCFLLWPSERPRTWKIILPAVLLAGGVFLFIRYMNEIQALSRFALIFSGDKGSSINLRFRWLASSFELGMHSPLFGRGTGSFPALTFGADFRAYPHNIFAELFLENGLAGITIFSVFLLHTCLHAVRLWRNGGLDSQAKLLLLSLTACFVFSAMVAQVSGDFYDNRLPWLYGSAILGLSARPDEMVPGLGGGKA